ncbi:MAG TPA: glycerol-3-phosphate 1-O-acyltransferase PlsY [Thermomicrobiales bacterium]|nr:acyl-phosphate glycerol 3-phosphate acyltransferase [Chloroflexota bacterium]HQX63129.1 glycerol-3-phosphate 1-O-acyltransferase PlsY [Thermomicrobiales bacterium]HQZ88786.1 glycerol-3-phosphate 1-O-acyltransferase PlsY [Thermomicrobiales bacterium]
MSELAALLIAYLLGTLPTGYLLTRFIAGVDLRSIGSGGTGATNAQRALGTRWGIIVLVVDLLKGVAAILLARWLGVAELWVSLAGVAVVAGHCWPVWLRFRGGKGVATGAGAAFALSPWMLLLIPIMVIPIATSRYVSLGSVVAALSTPVLFAVLAWVGAVSWETVVFGLAAGAIIIYRHRSNIDRLRAGTERKLGRTPAEAH